MATMQLILSREEYGSPVWQQCLNNGALSPNNVLVWEDEIAAAEGLNGVNEGENDISLSDEDNVSSDDEEEGETLQLRDYQRELADPALRGRNSIVCAPTGSGKTKVAIYIILQHLMSRPDAKIAFFARSVPLAKQQFKVIKRHLPDAYKAFLMTGESSNSMSLHHLLPAYSVAVLTPMILVNHLMGRQPLLVDGISAFSLMVIDECHHTRKGEPYNNIMYYYIRQKLLEPWKRLPQIVGLTASIGVEKAKDLDEAIGNIQDVCANLDADKIVTVRENLGELNKRVPVPSELVELLVDSGHDVAIREIERVMKTLEDSIKQYAGDINDEDVGRLADCPPPNKKLPEYCQWVMKLSNAAEEVAIQNRSRETQMSVRFILIITFYLKNYHFALEAIDLVQVQEVVHFLERCFSHFYGLEDRSYQERIFYSYFTNLRDVLTNRHFEPNQNLEILAGLLQKHILSEGNTSRAIVFVRTRMLAVAVESWLNRCGDEGLMSLRARKFTGTNAAVELGGMLESEQQDTMEQFRRGEVRVLVATSVAEEGLDIPECNLTIKYNHTGNEVNKVQTRGRGRTEDAVSILLAMGDVLARELRNMRLVQLMEAAINRISEMSEHELRREVNQRQIGLVQAWDQEEEEALMDVPFTVFCRMCRLVKVESTNTRTIYGKYRVSIDRELLNKIEIKPCQEMEMDELKFIGSAKCLGETDEGKICGNTLGSVIKHRGCPFVTLGIKNVVFQAENAAKPVKFKKWKLVTYLVQELQNEEMMAYATRVFRPDD